MKKEWKKYIKNPLLARIAGDITGDGHLQLQDWRGIVSFYSKNIEDINAINIKFETLFHIKGRIYSKKENIRYGIFFISKPLAEFLKEIGIPPGNKTNNVFFVPNWISKGNQKLQIAYLQGLFASEGTIYATQRKNQKIRWRIAFEMAKHTKLKEEGKKYIEQLSSMLNRLGIKTSPVRYGKKMPRKDGTKSIAIKFEIESREFSKFFKYIRFDNKLKDDKLQKVIAEALSWEGSL